jgi:anti-anti-sigma factor
MKLFINIKSFTMTEITSIKRNDYIILSINGRIDGSSSFDLDSAFQDLTSKDTRKIIVNFSNVTYLSSAGIRVFVNYQKKLKKIDGEILLHSMTPVVDEVFKLSGLKSVFKIINSDSEFESLFSDNKNSIEKKIMEFGSIKYEEIDFNNVKKSRIKIISPPNKLNSSSFSSIDVKEVNSSELKFSNGLAAIGDEYDDYKHLFGESVSVENHFFTYPAVKNPMVDFMNNIDKSSSFVGKFFYGYSWDGDYSKIIKIESSAESYELNEIIGLVKNISNSKVIGLTILAESAGLLGMHIKKVPIIENQPQDKEIFSTENFYNWFDFPIEHTDIGAITLSAGLICKDFDNLIEEDKHIFTKESNFHIHSVVFENGLISRNTDEFKNEINRVVTECEPIKIQHLLNKSKLKNIMLGIIEMEI